MRTINETKEATQAIKALGLWDRYQKQKSFFISNPAHRSLDFIIIDKKNGISSFKITNQYRVKVIKTSENTYIVISAGDFHKKS